MATPFRMFAAEFEPAQRGGGRRSVHAPVSLDARIGRGGLDRALCRVIDLSMHGARLQLYSELAPGALLWLTLPGIGHFAAEVVWAADFEAGIEFRSPLSERDFNLLAA
jgi:hypothetical protein